MEFVNADPELPIVKESRQGNGKIAHDSWELENLENIKMHDNHQLIMGEKETKILVQSMTFRERKKKTKKKEQVTRGHNFVADGWAGASNPYPYPNSHPQKRVVKHARAWKRQESPSQNQTKPGEKKPTREA